MDSYISRGSIENKGTVSVVIGDSVDNGRLKVGLYLNKILKWEFYFLLTLLFINNGLRRRFKY